jgi:hypothetical protein
VVRARTQEARARHRQAHVEHGRWR